MLSTICSSNMLKRYRQNSKKTVTAKARTHSIQSSHFFGVFGFFGVVSIGG